MRWCTKMDKFEVCERVKSTCPLLTDPDNKVSCPPTKFGSRRIEWTKPSVINARSNLDRICESQSHKSGDQGKAWQPHSYGLVRSISSILEFKGDLPRPQTHFCTWDSGSLFRKYNWGFGWDKIETDPSGNGLQLWGDLSRVGRLLGGQPITNRPLTY